MPYLGNANSWYGNIILYIYTRLRSIISQKKHVIRFHIISANVISKVRHSLRRFSRHSKAFCADLLYRITPKWENKRKKHERKFIYVRSKIPLIFTNLNITQYNFMDTSPTEFYSNQKKNVENTGKVLLTPLRIAYGFHCTDFHETYNCSKALSQSPTKYRKYEYKFIYALN